MSCDITPLSPPFSFPPTAATKERVRSAAACTLLPPFCQNVQRPQQQTQKLVWMFIMYRFFFLPYTRDYILWGSRESEMGCAYLPTEGGDFIFWFQLSWDCITNPLPRRCFSLHVIASERQCRLWVKNDLEWSVSPTDVIYLFGLYAPLKTTSPKDNNLFMFYIFIACCQGCYCCGWLNCIWDSCWKGRVWLDWKPSHFCHRLWVNENSHRLHLTQHLARSTACAFLPLSLQHLNADYTSIYSVAACKHFFQNFLFNF